MHPWDIRNQLASEEIDYVALKAILADYAYPRDKITQLLNTKALIRVKKGLYVFGPEYARKLFSKEVLANLIYGPSAVSLEYALAFYQLIPERVTTVTSITTKRSKTFVTPIGRFNYHPIDLTKYDVGLLQMPLAENRFFMMASREKALADYLFFRKPKLKFTNQNELLVYLQTQLRMDLTLLAKFNKSRMREIARVYQHSAVDLLSHYLQQISDE